MKRILLASASMVAFAGAASAEVTFGGSATLGYNDTVNASDDNDYGFYWDANVAVTLGQELDNGVTASVTFDFDVADATTGLDLESGGYVLSLTTDTAALYYGDTSFAAETYWSGVGDMEADNFSEADGEVVLRGESMFAGFTGGLSYVIADADGGFVGDGSSAQVDQLSLGMTGMVGMFTMAFAYQAESDGATASYDPNGANGDFNLSEMVGVRAGVSAFGADLAFGYASNLTTEESSIGVQGSYPIGPVTVTVYYVVEDDLTDGDDNYGVTVAYASGPIAVTFDFDDDQGTQKFGLDGSYDVGNGLSVLAGFYSQANEVGDYGDDEYYIAATYDLGGGASILGSFASGADNADDEIGAGDYQEGTTVELSFEF